RSDPALRRGRARGATATSSAARRAEPRRGGRAIRAAPAGHAPDIAILCDDLAQAGLFRRSLELVLRPRLEVARFVSLAELGLGAPERAVDHAPALHRRAASD